jgi:hypothetical protein
MWKPPKITLLLEFFNFQISLFGKISPIKKNTTTLLYSVKYLFRPLVLLGGNFSEFLEELSKCTGSCILISLLGVCVCLSLSLCVFFPLLRFADGIRAVSEVFRLRRCARRRTAVGIDWFLVRFCSAMKFVFIFSSTKILCSFVYLFVYLCVCVCVCVCVFWNYSYFYV